MFTAANHTLIGIVFRHAFILEILTRHSPGRFHNPAHTCAKSNTYIWLGDIGLIVISGLLYRSCLRLGLHFFTILLRFIFFRIWIICLSQGLRRDRMLSTAADVFSQDRMLAPFWRRQTRWHRERLISETLAQNRRR